MSFLIIHASLEKTKNSWNSFFLLYRKQYTRRIPFKRLWRIFNTMCAYIKDIFYAILSCTFKSSRNSFSLCWFMHLFFLLVKGYAISLNWLMLLNILTKETFLFILLCLYRRKQFQIIIYITEIFNTNVLVLFIT